MPLVDAFGYTNVKVEGYEADDVIASLVRQAARAGDRGDGRHRRPRRLPAGRRGGAGDEHLARDHRDQDLRPRGRARALRGAAGAGHRPDGPAGRHLRQYPRRAGDRRENRRRSCCSSSARWRRCSANVDKVSGAKRKQNLVEHADDARMSKRSRRCSTTSRRASTWPRRWPPSPTAAPCASSCASSSCGRCWSGSKKRCPRARRSRAARSRPSSRSRRSRARPTTSATARWRWRSTATAGPPRRRAVVTGVHPGRAGGGAGRHAVRRPRREVPRRRSPRAARRRRPRGHRTGARPRHDGRRLPARAPAPHLRADRAGRRRGHRPRRRRPAPWGARTRGSSPLGDQLEAGLDPAEEARLVAALADVQRPRSSSLAWTRCCARSSCRSSTCWRRWSARG